MIKTFADKETQNIFAKGKSKRLPPNLTRRAIRRLEFIHWATNLNDLRVPPSNRLHALKRAREGQHSISINHAYPIETGYGSFQQRPEDYRLERRR